MSTDQEILAAIKASDALKSLADANEDGLLATALSAILPKVFDPARRLKESDILRILGPIRGDAALQGVASLLPFVSATLRSEGLSLAASATGTTELATFLSTNGVVTPQEFGLIAAAFQIPQTIDPYRVSGVLAPFRPNGVGPIDWNRV